MKLSSGTKHAKKIAKKTDKMETQKAMKQAESAKKINKNGRPEMKNSPKGKNQASPNSKWPQKSNKDTDNGKSIKKPSDGNKIGTKSPIKFNKFKSDANKTGANKTGAKSPVKFSKPKSDENKTGTKTFANKSNISKKRKLEDDETEGKTNKKQDIKKERQATKPNFKLVENLKLSWNQARLKVITPKERSLVIQNMVKQITGHVLQVTLRHDASRAVQSILQFGNPEERKKVFEELLTNIIDICKTPYGHFAVLKAISYCTESHEQKKLVTALSNRFVSLAGHSIGARTVESILTLLPPKLTKPLRAEFYGKKFTLLLDEIPKDLSTLLEKMPSKRSSILDHMRDIVQRFVQKGLLDFRYVHQVLWEYTKEIIDDTPRMTDLTNQLLDATPRLMSTKPGVRTCCHMITFIGAKERKRIMKSLKGRVLESLLHESGHLAIMRLVDVTDDTVQIQKSILEEILIINKKEEYTADGKLIQKQSPLLAIATNVFGSKFLLRLLSPSKRHLEPDEDSLFGLEVTSSKKSHAMRRSEHLAYLRMSLLSLCVKHTETLLRSRCGGKVLEEVVRIFHPVKVIQAIANVFAGIECETVDDEEEYDETRENMEYDENDAEEEEEDGERDGEEEGEEYQPGEGGGEQWDDDNEEGGDDDDDDDVEMSVPEEELEQDEEEDEVAETKVVAEPAPVLPIYEDGAAHTTLKRLLQLESSAITTTSKGNEETTPIDESLWVDAADADYEGLAVSLMQRLSEANQLAVWIQNNRACFALVETCKIPAARDVALGALLEFNKQIKESATNCAGAKLLKSTLIDMKKVS
eukprot:gene2567-5009_t